LNSEPKRPAKPIDRDQVALAHGEHAQSLERFLLGILRDSSSASDALQATFTRLLEKGHLIEQTDSLKSWLFRVAYNEAMFLLRREATGRKHAEQVAWKIELSSHREGYVSLDESTTDPVRQLVRVEHVTQVRDALSQLPDSYRHVVEKRIYENMKFREIANELDVPLGTVLARMQAALKKLKPLLADLE
jgi:RNA polymerase sigma-70 factor (ECF subfamily)